MNHRLDTLPFTNSFVALSEAFYSRVEPTPFESTPSLIHFNDGAAALLDLDPAVSQDRRIADIFSGKKRLPGMTPIAMLYAGHQFGVYVPELGDGRAIILGETTNSRGERWEIQLKGSGLTPYSRDGDGRAVLRSSIREYLCSEAMHSLGIPTTRALCLVGSQDEVYRERIETGAILTRLAPTHVRFGSFEVFYYRDQHERTKQLADYVIAHHYPDLLEIPDGPARYLGFLQAVIERTAKLMAQWQAVGFAHGVMNTDNMSILGLTLDYGPFGFMEAYDPGFICNHSDYHGRYAFDRQPQVALFNLSCLAQALLPLLELDAAKAALDSFSPCFTAHYQRLMARKLGFDQADAAVLVLLTQLFDQMRQSGVDYTRLFRGLCQLERDADQKSPLRDVFIDRERFDRWVEDYRAHLRAHAKDDEHRGRAMSAINPKYVLRNYLAQIAIDKAQHGDYSEINSLMKVLSSPFEEHPEAEHYAEPAPDWAKNIHVSCSS